MLIHLLDRLARTALLAGFVTLLAISAGGNAAKAQTTVAVGFFYDELAPNGYWVEDRYYGTVWYPSRRGPDWRPYSYGRWVWTSDYGWYWESDEPWGWAVYHYGRWVYTVEYGWVWVPGDDWGPAWVEWRYGGGYVGWAPMPPEVMWRNNAVFYGSVDLAAPRYHPSWVFVGEVDFARGSVNGRTLPASQNGVLLGATARSTSYAAVNGRVVNRGVDVTRLSAATQLRIDPVRVARSETLVGAGARTAGQLRIYQPRVVARGAVGRPPAKPPLRFDVDDRVQARPPELPPVGGPVGGGVDLGRSTGGLGVGGGPSVGGGGLGVGGGGGLGIGGGGGLRIGR